MMPLVPLNDRPESYSVSFIRNGISFLATVTSEQSLYDEMDADTAAQDLVDHLDGWADSIEYATKSRVDNYSITVTP